MINMNLDVEVNGLERVRLIVTEIEKTQQKLEALTEELTKAVKGIGYVISNPRQRKEKKDE